MINTRPKAIWRACRCWITHGNPESCDIEVRSQRLARALAWCFGLIMLAVLVQIGRLQMFPSENLRKHAPQTSTLRQEIAFRGSIRDRRGRTLATSRVGYRMFVDPQWCDDVNTIAADIGQLLGIDPIAIDRLIQKRLDTRYVRVLPFLTDAQIEVVRQASLKGVGLEPVLMRHRTGGDLAAAIVGTVRQDGTGLTGAEQRFEGLLTGSAGSLRYLRDVQRRALWVQPVDYSASTAGEDVFLSIDLEIQRIAFEELTATVEAVNAGGGHLLVVDPQTGELLAAVDVIRHREDFEDYTTDEERETDPALGRMRCATDMYEPGSTFKPYVWAAAIDAGVVTADEVFDLQQGSFILGRRRIRDAHPYDEYPFDMVLIKSSNIGMAQAAVRMSHDQMRDAILSFGFGTSTESGFLGEMPGIVTSVNSERKWTEYTQASVSFGQEIAVTPLQMVRAFCAFARDGTLPRLRLTCAAPGISDGLLLPAQSWNRAGLGNERRAVLEQRAIAESIALQTRHVLRRVMLEGTGRAANEGARYSMFAKSGTPQMPDRVNGGYHQDRYVPSFIAGAPFDLPRVVVLCVIEDPDKRIGHYGGSLCGPVVRNVVNRTLEYMGVPSDLVEGTGGLTAAEADRETELMSRAD
ncbi:MAG: penicillin-binding protein 2 [Planctomycetes bacterium]|nr:penicillin-binding protein 2 [Planctomycetota bacterium]NOG54293.1 penicillin-binding protein 2 [Planctomycetota bacterium]